MALRMIAVLALGICVSAVVNAQIAFSSFDVGDAFDTEVGTDVRGPLATPNWTTQYSQFESAATGILDTIRFAHSRLAGPDDYLRVTLYRDNLNQVGNWWVSSSGSYTSSTPEITTFTYNFDGVVLTAGQKYWIGLYTFEDVWHEWNSATSNMPLGRTAYSHNGFTNLQYQDNSVLGAFEVTVRPVPEPATALILLIGVSPILRRVRLRNG